jgi:deazaflavin-dependent oxidoreductase (nitroreductase family)
MIPAAVAHIIWRVFNPLVVWVSQWVPVWAVLETTGRRTGRRILTPVANTLDGDVFWILAVHGRRSGYVLNIEAGSPVRIRIGRHWRSGAATIVEPTGEVLAKFPVYPRSGPRVFRGDAVAVRVELGASTPQG